MFAWTGGKAAGVDGILTTEVRKRDRASIKDILRASLGYIFGHRRDRRRDQGHDSGPLGGVASPSSEYWSMAMSLHLTPHGAKGYGRPSARTPPVHAQQAYAQPRGRLGARTLPFPPRPPLSQPHGMRRKKKALAGARGRQQGKERDDNGALRAR